MIDLYAAGTSNGMRAKIMLEECGVPYTLHSVDLAKAGLATDPRGRTAEAVSALRVRLIQQNKKIAPYIDAYLTDALKGIEGLDNAIAVRRENEVGARIAEATAQDKITREKAEAARAVTEARTAVIMNAIQTTRQRLGEDRMAPVIQAMQSGAPVGQAFRLFGVPLPEGVDPSYTLPSAVTGRETDAQRRAGSLLSAFRTAKAQAAAVGPVPLSFVNSVRSRFKGEGVIGGTVATLANVVSSEKQNQLFNAYNTMAQMWRFNVSGAASALGEAPQLMQLLAPLQGDGPNVQLGKAQLANAIEQAIADVAGERISPTQAVDYLLSVARANKMKPEVIKALTTERGVVERRGREQRTLSGIRQQGAAPRDATADPVIGQMFAPARP